MRPWLLLTVVNAAVFSLGPDLVCCADPLSRVLINEIEASGGLTWIELRSLAEEDQLLDGTALSLERVDPSPERRGTHLFEFPPGLVLPGVASPRGPYLVICCGGFPQDGAAGNCSTPPCDLGICIPFDLDQDGGTITLTSREPCSRLERAVLDRVRYPPLPDDRTYGRDDRLDWCIFSSKTPGKSNAQGAQEPQSCVPNLEKVRINEVSSAGAFDWLELYLAAGEPTPLGAYQLLSHGLPVALPNVTLFPRAPLAGECDPARVVLVLNSDERPPGACGERTFRVDAPFGLNAKGDSLTLLGPDGNDWDAVTIPPLAVGEILSRLPDAGDFDFTREETPSTPNPPRRGGTPPLCEVIDRFPFRVTPGTEVEVYASVLDREGQDDLEKIELAWRPLFDQGPPRTTRMFRSKRVTCNRFEETGIYRASIPAAALAGPGELEYWVSAEDRSGRAGESARLRLNVQDPGWVDPGGLHFLRINEVSANETGGLPDWVEIFNTNPNPAAPAAFLGGLYLTEDIFVREGRRLDAALGEVLFLEPGGHLQVFLGSGPGPEPRLDFRLDDCRDEVILIHRDEKTVIDAVAFHEEKRGRTLGRIPDGGLDLSIQPPTPGAANVLDSCLLLAEDTGLAPLVLNELCADNWESASDAGGEHGDWVEIFNRSNDLISLKGWGLSDAWESEPPESTAREIWRFPAGVTIGPGEYLLVWCDSDAECETLETTGELHASFQLNRGSDFVQLLDPCGALADALLLNNAPRDLSLGRFPDGARASRFLEPTPGAPNEALPPFRVQVDPAACRSIPVELLQPGPHVPGVCPFFRRGDADSSCGTEITDAILILGHLFKGGLTPACPDAADANDDGKIDLSDAVELLGYLFLGRAEPPAPGPEMAGPDPTPDALQGCAEPRCVP